MNRRELLRATAGTVAFLSVSTTNATSTTAADEGSRQHKPGKTLSTRFTQKAGIRHPFICAGMGFVCDKVDLCIAVSKAGGVGALSASLLSPMDLREKIRQVKAATSNPFHINFLTLFPHDEQLKVCIEEKVPAVSFHFGLPSQVEVTSLQSAGVAIWTQIGSVDDAKEARVLGVDAIVVQGGEAGGHTYDGMPISALLPAVRDAVDDTLLFAAGGIADGRTAAAALAAGADAIWVGTLMVATTEANAHQEYKRKLVEAEGEQTIVTGVYGPENSRFNPMRVLENETINTWQNRVQDIPKDRSHLEPIGSTLFAGQKIPVKPFDTLVLVPETTGDLSQMPMLAGQGVGLVKDIQPTETVIETVMNDAASVVERQSVVS